MRFVYFETYMQERCVDWDFVDSHITVFCMKKRDARKLLKSMGFGGLTQFLREYTYDWSERLYMAAKEAGMIEDEFIERSSI